VRHEGDPRAAFEQLFVATRADLLAYLLRRSPTAEDAADALAETYLIAWQKLDAIPAGQQARLWLFGVARNVLRRGATRRASSSALAGRLASEIRASEAARSEYDERAEFLRQALDALGERDREVMMLTAWEGLTPAEIAATTGNSANLIRVRLHRARARLKQHLTSDRLVAERQKKLLASAQTVSSEQNRSGRRVMPDGARLGSVDS